MAERTSPRDFVTRKRNLQDGSGSSDRLNDHYFLQLGLTAFDDGDSDSVAGGNANRIPSAPSKPRMTRQVALGRDVSFFGRPTSPNRNVSKRRAYWMRRVGTGCPL